MVEMRRQSTANTSSGSSNSMDVLHEGTKQPRMPRRRIIACLDGTWNTPSAHTNVFRFYNNIEQSYPVQKGDDSNSYIQVAEYFLGVGGAEDGIKRYLGGAFGFGISDQILSAYAFISENYQCEEDEIWLLGVSRGAYAARSLAGMIYNVGLLPCKHITTALDEAYSLYRRKDRASHPHDPESLAFRAKYGCWHPDIRFLGCFDTVGSLGVPRLPWYLGGSLLWSLFHGLHYFHDTKLSPKVISAFHAIAIHEQRAWFRPTLMQYATHKREHQQLEQLWFPGTHSDLSGVPKSSHVLANHALRWMMTKAQDCGMVFRQPIDDVCGAQAFTFYDSYNAESVYRLVPRRDRYIDPAIFPGMQYLYQHGQFTKCILTRDQLSLYPSKTLSRFKKDLAEFQKKQREQKQHDKNTSAEQDLPSTSRANEH
ncbi:hypothetical protein LRAMOSA07914 [Lichtheimia ramosa]|uniref:T6SS Phospholipase effector Tle1-like catalytic domain-containing protein n=1 Tax=Lichtheimia ramosa TaxID=688394 RepID=A0A077WD81_9FUNG|nr:hypothetical protein LRAMOSA07914 [Lichtheimia ramosa]